jgi:hypothetical protein
MECTKQKMGERDAETEEKRKRDREAGQSEKNK